MSLELRVCVQIVKKEKKLCSETYTHKHTLNDEHHKKQKRYNPNRATKTDRTANKEILKRKRCYGIQSVVHTESVTQIRSTDKNVNFVLCEIPLYANQVLEFSCTFVSIPMCEHIIIAHHKK